MMENIPTMQCPKCGYEDEDFDGFGFIGQCPKCGYCNHPNKTLENKKWICGILGLPSSSFLLHKHMVLLLHNSSYVILLKILPDNELFSSFLTKRGWVAFPLGICHDIIPPYMDVLVR
jgi:predicted nucleic-acid-binding Zn-ribbon protein